jgi:PadR family transcriptional regulator PadR
LGGNGFLGEFEQMVLLAILRLGDGAYGRAIRDELEARANRTVTHGASYITLDRMVSKGLLESELREPDPGRGGRAKRYFRVTPAGVGALRESRAALQNLWDGLEAILDEA